jgi:hypothetical protein
VIQSAMLKPLLRSLGKEAFDWPLTYSQRKIADGYSTYLHRETTDPASGKAHARAHRPMRLNEVAMFQPLFLPIGLRISASFLS